MKNLNINLKLTICQRKNCGRHPQDDRVRTAATDHAAPTEARSPYRYLLQGARLGILTELEAVELARQLHLLRDTSKAADRYWKGFGGPGRPSSR